MHPVQYTVATEEQRKLKLNIVKANVTTNVDLKSSCMIVNDIHKHNWRY